MENDKHPRRINAAHHVGRWLLAAAFTAGAFVYLGTTSPMAGAVLPALSAATGSIGTGLWVLRADPARSRAWTCLAFYIATAFWQAAAASLASVVMFVLIEQIVDRAPRLEQFVPTMLVLVTGVTVSTAIGLAAICSALKLRLKVFIHPKLPSIVDHDLSSDGSLRDRPRFNYAVFVVGTALVLPVLVIGCLVLIAVSVDQPKDAELVPALAVLFAFFAVPFGMIPFYAWLSSRIIARSPYECWPLGES